jgi:hypothetical protein
MAPATKRLTSPLSEAGRKPNDQTQQPPLDLDPKSWTHTDY